MRTTLILSFALFFGGCSTLSTMCAIAPAVVYPSPFGVGVSLALIAGELGWWPDTRGPMGDYIMDVDTGDVHLAPASDPLGGTIINCGMAGLGLGVVK